jgi:hydrogenase nickel incorporation protein HypA/HybF
MHELPATQGMLEVALDAARGAGATRIREIHLVVGELTSMVDDSVQFYFDILARGTMAEGARLVFRREPAILACRACGHGEEVVPPLRPTCPRCGSLQLEVTGGQAFRVESLDADDGAAVDETIDTREDGPASRENPSRPSPSPAAASTA